VEINTERHRFRTVLGGYMAKQPSPTSTSHRFQKLLGGFHSTLRAWQKSEQKTASDFDLLETLQFSEDELRHSMMLAWLLDNRIERAGTHAQGNLGFRLFLEELGLNKDYATSQYWVLREVRGDESRVDVEIAARSQFIIHIENKIYSEEGVEQTSREWRDLSHRATQLSVKPNRVHGIFLTLAGRPSSNPNFILLSWRRIGNVLDRFSECAKAPEVSMFASHYARALRRMTIQQSNTDENENETNTEI
jgi:hypothetical protein